jgi:ribosomal protein S17E
MDQFMEELQRQTGLSVEETAMYARLGQYIVQDREYRDNPEGARQRAYENFQEHMEVKEQFDNAESIEDLDMPEEIVRMAEEFNNMLEERHEKNHKIEAELASLEADMLADELAGVFTELENLLKNINEEDQ